MCNLNVDCNYSGCTLQFSDSDANLNLFKIANLSPLTCASELVCCEAVDGFVLQMNGLHAPGPAVGEAPPPQPVGEPGHVTVAVERIGDQVEAGQARQLVEGARGDAADQVTVQRQALEVVQAPEQCSVHHGNLVLGKQSAKNNSCN